MSDETRMFVAAHAGELWQILDAGEAILHQRVPDIEINGSLDHKDSLQLTVNGQDITEIDDEIEREDAEHQCQDGRARLIGLRGRSIISLIRGGVNAPPESYTKIEDARRVNDRALGLFRTATGRYSTLEFVNEETDELLGIGAAQITGSNGRLLARSVRLELTDKFISRQLSIYELPSNFDGEVDLLIGQELQPANDQLNSDLADFFTKHGDVDDMRLATEVFFSEVFGQDSDALVDLHTKYAASEHFDELWSLIQKLLDQARAAREGRKLANASTNVNLPSAQELEDYTALLDGLSA